MVDLTKAKHIAEMRKNIKEIDQSIHDIRLSDEDVEKLTDKYYATILECSRHFTCDFINFYTPKEFQVDCEDSVNVNQVIPELQRKGVHFPYSDKLLKQFITSDAKIKAVRMSKQNKLSISQKNIIVNYYAVVNRLWRTVKSNIPLAERQCVNLG